MNELVEKLLKPVSPELPCGPDLSDAAPFDNLARILKGKPEVEIGTVKKPAEPPDWRELKDRSAEYFAQSKHLRVAVMLCGCWLKTGGLAGLRDGLQLIRGLLEQYWVTLYPVLDPTDNNDPTQRLNMLSALNSPRGTIRPDIQQWLAIVDYLYSAPLCRPKGADPITLDQVIAARKRSENKPPAEGESSPSQTGPDIAGIGKAFRAAATSEIEATNTAVAEAVEALTGIDQFLTQTLGAGETISFDELHSVLKEIQAVLKANLPGVAAAAGTEAGESGGVAGAAQAGSSVAISVSGSIRSRDDVVRTLDAICEFYNQVEPSSPVPYLLRRAQKMTMMNFVEAVHELNIATVDTLKPSMGSALDTPTPPPE